MFALPEVPFSRRDAKWFEDSQRTLITAFKKRSQEAIDSASDFVLFRKYVCGMDTYPYMHTWLNELNTGKDSKFLRGIAGDDTCILAPRGSSKSTVMLQWIAWIIGVHANHGISLKILYISYVIDVASSKSRQIKAIIESERYQEVFPIVRPSKSKWGESEWAIDFAFAGLSTIEEPYTLACSGLQGAINSKRCLVGDTMVLTEFGEIPIKELGNHIGIKVLTYNESANKTEWKRITVFASRPANDIYEFRAGSGDKLRCTSTHPIYIPGYGYRQAQDLCRGDSIVRIPKSQRERAQLFGMQQPIREKEQWQNLPELLPVSATNFLHHRVLPVQKAFYNVCTGIWQTVKNLQSSVLFSRMLWEKQPQTQAVSRLWCSDWARSEREKREILPRLSISSKATQQNNSRWYLPNLQSIIYQVKRKACLLFPSLCKQSSFCQNDRKWEQSSPIITKLYERISGFKTIYNADGQKSVRKLCNGVKPGSTSHQSQSTGQQYKELNNSVPNLPYKTSSECIEWETDTIELVKPIYGREETVYDIEVEDNHNFFANGILVHNSHILLFDDLLKSPSEAKNKKIQDRMMENYNSIVRFTKHDGARAINLGTRMAKFDLYATTFIPINGWKVIKQSALLSDASGEYSYCNDRVTLETLLEERRLDEESFLLQRQNEIPEITSQGIRPHLIKWGWMPAEFERIVIGLDTADSKEENSNATAIVIVGIANDCLYVLDAYEGRVQGNLKKIDLIYDYWAKRKNDCKYPAILAVDYHRYSQGLEGDVNAYMDDIREDDSLDNDFASMTIEKVKSTGRGEKIDRIESHSYLFEKSRIIFNTVAASISEVDNTNTLKKVVSEITDYNALAHNDLMDALEVAIFTARQYISGDLSYR